MSLFIPASEQYLLDIQTEKEKRYWKVLIDVDDDEVLEDVTEYLDNNQVTGTGRLEGANNEAVGNSWSVTLKNATLGLVEGDLARMPCEIQAKVGDNEYVTCFTGFVADEGCTRRVTALNKNTVTIALVDRTKTAAMNRNVVPTYFLNYKICDTVTTDESLFHALAAMVGLEAGDLDCVTITNVKDMVGLEKGQKVWREMQGLAAAFLGVLTFRYDGKLRLVSRFQTGYVEPSSEWEFNENNSWNISGSGRGILCNKVKAELEDFETESERVVYKNVENYDTETGKISIEVAAGEYWPGGTDDESTAQLGFKDPNSGEEWETCVSRETPTIGATGSDSDIECDDGVLTLESFDGVAGTNAEKTERAYKYSEIILKNATAGTVTITKFELCGQPVRILKKITVEDFDDEIENDWEFREKVIPGKYMTSESQAHETTYWWLAQGKARRKEYSFTTNWLPVIQEGAIVTLDWPSLSVSMTAQVLEYSHKTSGSPATWQTTVKVREWGAYTPAGTPSVTVTPAAGGPTEALTNLIGNTVTTALLQAGYTTGGGTKTPTVPVISLAQGMFDSIILIWDRQLNLTNFDHYDLQVSDDEESWYAPASGEDWKGAINEWIEIPVEMFVHSRIPFTGTEDEPTGRTLYYRVRRTTKAPTESEWSDSATGTTSTIQTGDQAAGSITANKLVAGILQTLVAQIATMLILDENLGYGGQTDEEPVTGSLRWYLYKYGLRGEVYDGEDWDSLIKIGDVVNDVFQPYIRALALLHKSVDASALDIGDGAPDGSTCYGFENNLTPISGSTIWTETSGQSYSSATKKYGTYSITTASLGYIRSSASAITLTACGISLQAYLPSTIPMHQLLFFDDGAAGGTWTEQTDCGGRNWYELVGSADGLILYAMVINGYIYKSTDGGANWDALAGTEKSSWYGICCSADGQYVIAAVTNGYIYTSVNGGADWTERTGCGARNWRGPCCSADGQFIAVADAAGYIYTSENGGADWTEQTGSGSRAWNDIACSVDGTKLSACVYAGYIYTSVNGGADWTERTGCGSRNWNKITSSADGSRIAACVFYLSGYIYTSVDSGANWTERTGCGSRAWIDVKISSNGQVIIGANSSGYIYTSVDSGANWTERTGCGSRAWGCIFVSADGAKFVAGNNASGGYIYTSISKSAGVVYLNGDTVRFYARTASGENSVDKDVTPDAWNQLVLSPQDDDIFGAVNGDSFVASDPVLDGSGRVTVNLIAGIYIDDSAVAPATEFVMAELIAHFLAGVKWSLIDITADLPICAGSNELFLQGSKINVIGDLDVTGRIMVKRAVYRHQMAAGTDGGGTTAGSRQDCPITNEISDEIGITLASNTLTIPAGTYLIRAWHVFYGADSLRTYLYNNTTSADIAQGLNCWAELVYHEGYPSYVEAVVTFTTTTEVKHQYRCSRAVASNGLGYDCNWGTELEIYGEIIIDKLG